MAEKADDTRTGGTGLVPTSELETARTFLAEVMRRVGKDPVSVLEPTALSAALIVQRHDPATFERYRKNLKDRHVRLAAFDEAIRRSRLDSGTHNSVGGATPPIEAVWAQTVDGAALLDEMSTLVLRHVVLPQQAADAIALWILHAHALDAAEHTPRLRLPSPQKRCGKTRTIMLLEHLVPRPLTAANATPAALFRHIAANRPTLLVDEADTFIRAHQELRGIVNAGHDRNSAFVLRVEGKLSVWAAMAIASIGPLWDSLEDRSIHIHLKRKLPREKVLSFGKAARALANILRQKAARWAIDNMDMLRNSDPQIPEGLDDRAADNWRPLLAIADSVGGSWSDRARVSALELSKAKADETDSIGVRLLTDIQRLFLSLGATRLRSQQICESLAEAWSSYGSGGLLNEFTLAALLRPFGIFPKVIRFNDHAADENPVRRGYELADFCDAFERYVTP
jgi:putative DNA primase/helicase